MYRVIQADSVPVLDGWGFDLSGIGIGEKIWTAQEWIDWHKAMIKKYGKEKADNSFVEWFDSSTYGAAQISYSVNSMPFKAYVIQEGLNIKSSILSRVYKAETALNNIGEPIRNLGAAISNTTGAIKYIAPLAVAGIALILLLSIYTRTQTKAA